MNPIDSNRTVLVPFSFSLILTLGLVACGGGGGSVAPTSVLPTITLPIPASSYPVGSAELAGYTVLQQARALCGFGVLRQDTRLDAASRNHARYLTSVSFANWTHLLSHYEDTASDPYYTGYYPWDRTMYTGYGTQVAEILVGTWWDYDISYPSLVIPTMAQRGTESMRSLLNTVYHLSGAMFDGADVGFGVDIQTVSTSATTRREEYRFGSLNGYQTATITIGTGNLATYPCQGSSNIPPDFAPVSENPNPFKDSVYVNAVVGPPIYLKVDRGQKLTVSSASRIVSQNGYEVPFSVLTNANDPNIDPVSREPYIDVNEAFVIPTVPLNPYTTYQITLYGTVDKASFTRSFAMSTGS
ncbi:hypothetical protein [Rhodoferax sp.]|uniref:hypothetical protein n=1 Tax=Rhodoferax sp. TaxID=50421 RepID=UPI00262CAF8E|nr:hypothetical protein [Rhodoferax sp.]MDD2918178.1 hypothetical protein [Rhodoferax sp.]